MSQVSVIQTVSQASDILDNAIRGAVKEIDELLIMQSPSVTAEQREVVIYQILEHTGQIMIGRGATTPRRLYIDPIRL